MNEDTSAQGAIGESGKPPGLKACPYCGAEVEDKAPYCWKCGKAQPAVLEYGEADAPLDEGSLQAVELEREEAQDRSLKQVVRSARLWIGGIAGLFYTVIYLLGAWRLTVPEGIEVTDKMRATEERLWGPWVAGTLAVLFIFTLADFLGEVKAGNRVNALLVSVIGLGLVLLILDILQVITFPFLRPLALVAIVAAFIALEGPKVAQRIYGAVMRR